MFVERSLDARRSRLTGTCGQCQNCKHAAMCNRVQLTTSITAAQRVSGLYLSAGTDQTLGARSDSGLAPIPASDAGLQAAALTHASSRGVGGKADSGDPVRGSEDPRCRIVGRILRCGAAPGLKSL